MGIYLYSGTGSDLRVRARVAIFREPPQLQISPESLLRLPRNAASFTKYEPSLFLRSTPCRMSRSALLTRSRHLGLTLRPPGSYILLLTVRSCGPAGSLRQDANARFSSCPHSKLGILPPLPPPLGRRAASTLSACRPREGFAGAFVETVRAPTSLSKPVGGRATARCPSNLAVKDYSPCPATIPAEVCLFESY